MPAFATVDEFAAILRCTPRMVRKHRKAGRLVMDGGRIVTHASIERINAMRDPSRGGPRRRRPPAVDQAAAPDQGVPPAPGSRVALCDAISNVPADAWLLLTADGAGDRWRDPTTLRAALQRASDRRVAAWLAGEVAAYGGDRDAGPLDPLSVDMSAALSWRTLPDAGIDFDQVPGPEELAAAMAATVDWAIAWMARAVAPAAG